ncbi:hypothetical protein GJ744_005568 [Endocarpon pusillum]|uniref:Sin3-associated polypeptide Sap18 n=1 Tax=Endocarpon pusillum TaxID=364733 RepID=A0A8H7AN26_9EURO|nr:hypothetical protein GJ744_005568 [Endocarpon pusillum]
MSSPKRNPDQLDRQTTTPFHLKLFYRLASFHHLTDFPIPTPATPSPALPQHLQIYTWPTCTLLELSHLLTTALPNLLPSPAIGTRLSFRLVYPDTRPLPPGRMREDDGMRGRWTSKEMGSVVISAAAAADDGVEEADAVNGTSAGAGIKFRNTEEAERTLADSRFVIGDFVDCAIFPPLPDGSVAPGAQRGGYSGGVGPRGWNGDGGPPRGEWIWEIEGRRVWIGQGDGFGGGVGVEILVERVPEEWRRERLPDSGYGRGGYGGGRGRGRGGY